MEIISYSDFLKVDIRVGTVVHANENNELSKPSIILEIDFGEEIGLKKSSAQLKSNYDTENPIEKLSVIPNKNSGKILPLALNNVSKI